jgi:hypothetical protein
MLTYEQRIEQAIQDTAADDRAEYERMLRKQIRNDRNAVERVQEILEHMQRMGVQMVSHKDLLERMDTLPQRTQKYLPIILAGIGGWDEADVEKIIRDRPHDKLCWSLVEDE